MAVNLVDLKNFNVVGILFLCYYWALVPFFLRYFMPATPPQTPLHYTERLLVTPQNTLVHCVILIFDWITLVSPDRIIPWRDTSLCVYYLLMNTAITPPLVYIFYTNYTVTKAFQLHWDIASSCLYMLCSTMHICLQIAHVTYIFYHEHNAHIHLITGIHTN